MACYGKKLNLTHDKSTHSPIRRHVLQREHRKLKPGSVAFYDIRPGDGAGLFSEEKMSK